MSVFALTTSKFLYGFSVTEDNNIIDFDEGSGELQAEIAPGNYSLGQFVDEVASALNEASTFTWTVTVSRTTRLITLTSSSAVDVLFSTGSNAASRSARDLLGADHTDRIGLTTDVLENQVGTVYTPQFKLQSYVPSTIFKKERDASRNESASGKVQIQTFGTESFMECNIQYATAIAQPSGGPITNNSTGVTDLISFMEAITLMVPVEFYIDASDNATYETMILESTEESKEGLGFKLKEMQSFKLRGYFETGKLTFRVIE